MIADALAMDGLGKRYGTFSDSVFVMCSQTFTLFRLRKTAVRVEISRCSFRVFVCACPSVISSISGKSFHIPFHYFVISLLS